jgi:hypothetical protein
VASLRVTRNLVIAATLVGSILAGLNVNRALRPAEPAFNVGPERICNNHERNERHNRTERLRSPDPSASGPAEAVRKEGITNIQQRIAILATVVLGLVMALPLLLAAGLPLGQAAWGGQDQILPPNLRWASLATVAILGLAAWLVLAGANLARPGAEPVAIRVVS